MLTKSSKNLEKCFKKYYTFIPFSETQQSKMTEIYTKFFQLYWGCALWNEYILLTSILTTETKKL